MGQMGKGGNGLSNSFKNNDDEILEQQKKFR